MATAETAEALRETGPRRRPYGPCRPSKRRPWRGTARHRGRRGWHRLATEMAAGSTQNLQGSNSGLILFGLKKAGKIWRLTGEFAISIHDTFLYTSMTWRLRFVSSLAISKEKNHKMVAPVAFGGFLQRIDSFFKQFNYHKSVE